METSPSGNQTKLLVPFTEKRNIVATPEKKRQTLLSKNNIIPVFPSLSGF